MNAPPALFHLTALLERQQDGGFSSENLASFFRRHREFAPMEKAEIAGWFYALIRQSKRLVHAFGPSVEPSPSALAALFLYLEGVLEETELARFAPGVDFARVRLRFETIEGVGNELERWAIEYNLSRAVANALRGEFGSEAPAFLGTIALPPPRTLRANRLRGPRADLAARLVAEGFEVEETRFATEGLVVQKGGDLFQTVAFAEGRFEAQDEGSQLIAEIVAPPPGGLIVDTCAGAGGKTLALASILGGRGRVLSLDIHEHKLEALRQRARRAGASNVEAIRIEAEGALPPRVEDHLRRADRILVDAPCSGLGVLRRNPEAGARLEAEDLERLPRLQREIVQRFVPYLKPGARLVYSTCTVLEAENEALVRDALADDKSLERVRVSEIIGGTRATPITEAQGTILKLRPEKHGTDGFFAAVLRRRR